MRFVFVLLTILLTAGMAAPTLADDVAPPGDPELTTPDGLTEDNYTQPDDAVPCGCGGPKAIYAAKYGTVQPPIMQQQQQEREAAEAAAAAAEAAQSQ